MKLAAIVLTTCFALSSAAALAQSAGTLRVRDRDRAVRRLLLLAVSRHDQRRPLLEEHDKRWASTQCAYCE
jgi:hypothetical protein